MRKNLLLLAMMASMTAGCASAPYNQHAAAPVEAPKGYSFGYQVLDMQSGSRLASQVFDDGDKTYFILPRGAEADRVYSPEHRGLDLVKQGPYFVAEGVGDTWFLPGKSGRVLCIRRGEATVEGCEAMVKQPPQAQAVAAKPSSVVVARTVTESGRPVVVERKLARDAEQLQAMPATYSADEAEQPRLQKATYAPLKPGEGARLARQSRDAEVARLQKQLAFLQQRLMELSKKMEMLNEI